MVTAVATFNLFSMAVHQSHYANETEEAVLDRQIHDADDERRAEELDVQLSAMFADPSGRDRMPWLTAIRHLSWQQADKMLRACDSSFEEIGRIFPRLAPQARAWAESRRRHNLTDEEREDEDREEQRSLAEAEQMADEAWEISQEDEDRVEVKPAKTPLWWRLRAWFSRSWSLLYPELPRLRP